MWTMTLWLYYHVIVSLRLHAVFVNETIEVLCFVVMLQRTVAYCSQYSTRSPQYRLRTLHILFAKPSLAQIEARKAAVQHSNEAKMSMVAATKRYDALTHQHFYQTRPDQLVVAIGLLLVVSSTV